LGMMSTRPFLYTPTQLYVVPRSMPITWPTAQAGRVWGRAERAVQGVSRLATWKLPGAASPHRWHLPRAALPCCRCVPPLHADYARGKNFSRRAVTNKAVVPSLLAAANTSSAPYGPAQASTWRRGGSRCPRARHPVLSLREAVLTGLLLSLLLILSERGRGQRCGHNSRVGQGREHVVSDATREDGGATRVQHRREATRATLAARLTHRPLQEPRAGAFRSP
jgi:hypothetical protein